MIRAVLAALLGFYVVDAAGPLADTKEALQGLGVKEHKLDVKDPMNLNKGSNVEVDPSGAAKVMRYEQKSKLIVSTTGPYFIQVGASEEGVPDKCITRANSTTVKVAACQPYNGYTKDQQWTIADDGKGPRMVFLAHQDCDGNAVPKVNTAQFCCLSLRSDNLMDSEHTVAVGPCSSVRSGGADWLYHGEKMQLVIGLPGQVFTDRDRDDADFYHTCLSYQPAKGLHLDSCKHSDPVLARKQNINFFKYAVQPGEEVKEMDVTEIKYVSKEEAEKIQTAKVEAEQK